MCAELLRGLQALSQRDPTHFYLVPLATSKPAADKADTPPGAGSGASEEWPVVTFLKRHGLERIAAQLSEELGLEQVWQLRFITQQHLDNAHPHRLQLPQQRTAALAAATRTQLQRHLR